MHDTDYINNLLDYNIDLTLTGHSHGGQVYIPFYGGVGKILYAIKSAIKNKPRNKNYNFIPRLFVYFKVRLNIRQLSKI